MLCWNEFTRSPPGSAKIWRFKEQRNVEIASKYEAGLRTGARHGGVCLEELVFGIQQCVGQLHVWLRGNSLSVSGKIEGKALTWNLAVTWKNQGWALFQNFTFPPTNGTKGQSKKDDFFQAVRGGWAYAATMPADRIRRVWKSEWAYWGSYREAGGPVASEITAGFVGPPQAYSERS